MLRPAPRNILQTDPGLSSAVGTMREEMAPHMEGGQNAQRGREPSNGQEQTGERQTLQSGEIAMRAPTLSCPNCGCEATTSTQDCGMTTPALS